MPLIPRYAAVRALQVIGSGVLYSKLRTLKWPSIPKMVARLDEEVQDYLFMYNQDLEAKARALDADAARELEEHAAAKEQSAKEVAEAEAAKAAREQLEREVEEAKVRRVT